MVHTCNASIQTVRDRLETNDLNYKGEFQASLAYEVRCCSTVNTMKAHHPCYLLLPSDVGSHPQEQNWEEICQ